jgi:hypothetical protein
MYPIRPRFERDGILVPSTSAQPAVGTVSPVRSRISVVLPDPFGEGDVVDGAQRPERLDEAVRADRGRGACAVQVRLGMQRHGRVTFPCVRPPSGRSFTDRTILHLMNSVSTRGHGHPWQPAAVASCLIAVWAVAAAPARVAPRWHPAGVSEPRT